MHRNSIIGCDSCKISKFHRVICTTHIYYIMNQIISSVTVHPSSQMPEYDGLVSKEDLDLLIEAPCQSPVVKRAALFSLLTGLRYSILQDLRWTDIVSKEGTPFVRHRHPEYGLTNVQLYETSLSYCGKCLHKSDLIFEGLPDESWLSVILGNWAKAAGIRHRLTFFGLRVSTSHCSSFHTYHKYEQR